MSTAPRGPLPDPMPDPTPDPATMRLRIWVRRLAGLILAGAMLVVIIRGVYVAWEVQQAAP